MKSGYQKLIDIGGNEFRGIKTSEASKLIENKDVVFADAREITEVEKHGGIPGSAPASRGMLEFLLIPRVLTTQVFCEEKNLSSTTRSGGVRC